MFPFRVPREQVIRRTLAAKRNILVCCDSPAYRCALPVVVLSEHKKGHSLEHCHNVLLIS